jgi:hypothetical protein
LDEAAEVCLKVIPPLINMPNDDVSPIDIGTDAAPQLHIIEMDNDHSTLAFKRRKAFRALSMITWGVMDGTFKKVLAVSAVWALSRSSHLSDNKGKLDSQVTKSSINSSVLKSERPSPSFNGEATASPFSDPSKLNVTQRAFSVIAISPTSL